MPSQIIQIPFVGGVQQKIAEEYIDPSTALLDVVNGVFTADGAIDTRLGIAPLSSFPIPGNPAMGAPVKLLSRGAEVLATDGDALYSYAPDGPAPGWSQRSLVSPCVATRAPIATLPTQTACHGFAEGSGRRMLVWRDEADGTFVGGTVFYAVQSLATGAFVVPRATVGANGVMPVVVYQGGNFFVFYASDQGIGTIVGTAINPNGVILSQSSIVTDGDCHAGGTNTTSTVFDATPEVGGTGLLLIYSQLDADGVSSSPRYLRLEALPALTISASAVVQNYNTTGSRTTLCTTRYDGTLGVVWYFWETLTGSTYALSASAYTTAFAVTSAAFNVGALLPDFNGARSALVISVEPLTVAPNPRALFLAYTRSSNGPAGLGLQLSQVATSIAAGAAAAAEYGYSGILGGGFGPSCAMLSRPFRATVGAVTRCYVLIQFSQPVTALAIQNCSTFLMDTGAYSASTTVRPRVAAVLAPRQSDTALASQQQGMDFRVAVPSGISAPASPQFHALIGIIEGEEFGDSLGSVGAATTLNVATLDFTVATGWQYAEGNGETWVSGGVPSVVSPGGVSEDSFFSWPLCSLQQAASGSLTLLGVYQVATCWSQVDDAGLIHRSAFTSAQFTLTGSNQTINVTTPDLSFTNRFTASRQPYLEVYRSQANQTTLYFDGTVPCSASDTSYATPLTYSITTSDAIVATRPLQYTTGGVLDSINPPSMRARLRHVDRLWGIDDTGLVIWYTTVFNAGDAPYHNESLTLSFTQEQLTALADMDDKLVAFSATSIWYVEGYGPAPTGLGSDLTIAVKVPTDTGAADWRSVVTVPTVGQFPGGVFFQGPANNLIYLLDRGLTVTCVGKMVQDWFTPTSTFAGATVLAAQMVPLGTQVRFLLSSGFVATYDYVQQSWSRQLYPPALVHSIQPVTGAWVAASSDGHVYAENAPTIAAPYFDTLSTGLTQWIAPKIRMASVKPGGLQGGAQLDFVQGLSRLKDPCDVLVTATYDYGVASETRIFKYSDLVRQSATLGQWRFSPDATLSQPMAVSITLSSAPPTGGTPVTGQGMRWLGVLFSTSLVSPFYDKLGPGVKQ
jgi:hypothetical protein